MTNCIGRFRLGLGVCTLLAALAGAPRLNAQAAVDVSVGFGTQHASAGTGIDITSQQGYVVSCTPANDLSCQSTQALGGLFMSIGGDVMFKEKFGAGFQTTFQPAKQDFGPLQSRENFIDINGIYAPISSSKWLVQILGGIGAARTSLSYTPVCPAGALNCSTSSQPVGSNTNFAVHVGVAFQYFVWNNVFIKPEFDYHYVPNLNPQFGNSVVGAMVSVGYGSHR